MCPRRCRVTEYFAFRVPVTLSELSFFFCRSVLRVAYRAAPVPRVAAPQKPTEIPRPRLPTGSVGRSALGFTGACSHTQTAVSARRDADFEGKTDEISHFGLKKIFIACGAL